MSEVTIVSVLVLTYNSAEYIIETLESIKNQSYEKIELIISDDKSIDNTIFLVEKWLVQNKDRFIRIEIVTGDINTGITKNMNRGIIHCRGTYIKPIAGDDLMLENCIEDMTIYMINNELNILYSKVMPFYDSDSSARIIEGDSVMYELFSLGAKQQYKKLLRSFNIYTIGIQLNREFIVSIGLFDEKYAMMEDYPLAIKITSLGYKLNCIDKYTMKYRIREKTKRSIFLKSKRNTVHFSNLRSFESEELIPRLKKEKMYFGLYDTYVRRVAVKVENLHSSFLFLVLGRLIRLFILQNWYNRINKFRNKMKSNAKFIDS